MSTFDGIVEEFPDIRIDHFRASSTQSRPPLAYFLSHVHSDHLNGLESCKSPFIYCSPATRDILLRLEKYPHRMNFAKGILETRQQTYRHLKTLLKAIPLETPTVIELSPGQRIQVTLFDANHCVGAVMFLIEGQGKAILYTGDIRSELWWVNALTRHPLLLPYLPDSKMNRKLDCLYLDTTFVVTGREDPYRQFPSKAAGIKELLEKVAQYPKYTFFYFDAWTFGYEDVWQALSHFLRSSIHVDDYRYRLYLALANGAEPKAVDAQKLIGFHCGNHFQQGCLTPGQSRVHTCEKGTACDIWNREFVRITPIISRYQGAELAELGAGGGQGDLNQQHELDVSDAQLVGQLMALCATRLQNQTQLLSGVLQMLTSAINEGVDTIALQDFILPTKTEMTQAHGNTPADVDELPLEKLVPLLAKAVTKSKQKKAQADDHNRALPLLEPAKRDDGLPKRITFPYSRHSSYIELCHLVEAFKPKYIHPCTVEETNWTPASSMSFLFGHLYETPVSFRHDQKMFKKRGIRAKNSANASRSGSSGSTSSEYATPNGDAPRPESSRGRHLWDELQATRGSRNDEEREPREVRARFGRRNVDVDHYSPPPEVHWKPAATAPPMRKERELDKVPWATLTQVKPRDTSPVRNRWHKRIAEAGPPEINDVSLPANKRGRSQNSVQYGRLSPPQAIHTVGEDGNDDDDTDADSTKLHHPENSQEVRDSSPRLPQSSKSIPLPHESKMALRREAYNAAIGSDGYEWSDIGLVSVNGHQMKEEEL